VGDAKGGAGVGSTNAGNDEWASVGGTGVGDNDGPAQGVPSQVTTVGPALVMMIEGPTWEVSVHEESGIVLLHDVPTQAEMVAVNALLGADGAHAYVEEPRLSDTAGGDVVAPESLEGPCLGLVVRSPHPSLPRCIASSDVVPVPGSLGGADPGVAELGLPSYPSTPSLPISLR
jgi:hypothetical protein